MTEGENTELRKEEPRVSQIDKIWEPINSSSWKAEQIDSYCK